MKRKGFTLIELLAVIVILAVIALIAVPIILNIVNKSKKSAFLDSAYGLVESAKLLYAESILDGGLSEEKTFSFDSGKPESLNYSGESPKGGMMVLTPNGEISIAIHNNEWCAVKGFLESEVTLTKYEEEKCILLENKEDPMIRLNGDATVYVELNGVYKELGAKASTRGGDVLEYTTEIKKEDSVVNSIDTSVEGEYKVVYSARSNEKTVTVTRTVVVLNMTPVITMTDSNEIYVKEKEVLINVSGVRPNTVTGFTYEVTKDGTALSKESVLGLTKTITFNETGIYEVVVTVTDNNGHKNTMSKTYKIDQAGPVITLDPVTVNLESEEVEGYDIFTGVSVRDNIDGIIDNSKIKTTGTLEKIPGTYEVTYTVSDSLGNRSEKIRTFIVTDQTLPEIVINPNEESTFVKNKTVTITATDNIKVNSITYVIIKDNVRGTEQTITNGGKVTLNNGTGNYVIEVTAVDSSNNRKTVSSGIYKLDNTVPSITVPENTVIKITEVTGYDLMTGITVSDNSGVIPTVETRGSLTATLGEQTIIYTVRDQAGNETTVNRKFTIVEAEGPILNFSNAGSSVWTKAQTITVTATDNSNLKTFTYEVIKDGVTKGVSNVSVSGKSAEASVPLNESGIYSIKLTGSDEYGNSTTQTSGQYKIDVTNPTVGSVSPSGTMGSNSWYTSNVTFSVTNGTDSLSGHKSTTVSPTSLTSNTTGSNVVVTTEDNAGNKVTKTFGPYKIDKTKPTISVKSTSSVTITKGASNAILSTYFNTPTWSISGTGSVTCKSGSTTVTNTSTLAVGTHTVTCTATGVNGLTKSASKTIIINNEEYAYWVSDYTSDNMGNYLYRVSATATGQATAEKIYTGSTINDTTRPSPNKLTLVANNNYIYWAYDKYIYRISATATGQSTAEKIYTGTTVNDTTRPAPSADHLTVNNNYIYWAYDKYIYRVSATTTGQSTATKVYTGSAANDTTSPVPNKLTLSATNNHIYWSYDKYIYRVSATATGQSTAEKIYTGATVNDTTRPAPNPNCITVNQNYIYWSYNKYIYRVSATTTGQSTVTRVYTGSAANDKEKPTPNVEHLASNEKYIYWVSDYTSDNMGNYLYRVSATATDQTTATIVYTGSAANDKERPTPSKTIILN